jgi:hypothetical protein
VARAVVTLRAGPSEVPERNCKLTIANISGISALVNSEYITSFKVITMGIRYMLVPKSRSYPPPLLFRDLFISWIQVTGLQGFVEYGGEQ